MSVVCCSSCVTNFNITGFEGKIVGFFFQMKENKNLTNELLNFKVPV